MQIRFKQGIWSVFFFWLAGTAASSPDAAGSPPRVVVSIAPLHSLVAGVMRDVAVPALILRGYASPHAHSLKPSDAGKLARADIVFWIGGQFEVFLRKPIAALSGDARVVEILGTPGLVLRRNRVGGAWSSEAHDRHASEKSVASDTPATDEEVDPHVWLDPANAVVMVRFIASKLGEFDPDRKDRYTANAVSLEQRLSRLDQRLAERLRPVRDVPFLVFHDAFQYLESRYGLAVLGAVALGPERLPGARRISELRERIRQTGSRCLFREPQFESGSVQAVLEGLGQKISVLDPLGAELEPGPDLYFKLMENNASRIAACLSG